MIGADPSIVSDVFELAGKLLWPALVLIVLYFARSQVRDALEAVSARIRDPKTDVDISKGGIHLGARQDATDAKLASTELDVEQLKSIVFGASQADEGLEEAAAASKEDNGVPRDLQRMAADYCAIAEPDWAARTRLKDEAARQMASYVIENDVRRELLAAQHNEGLILALAATIHSLPGPGDVGLLLRVSDETNRMHVQYRIVLAFGRLAERGLATSTELASIRRTLDVYERGADSPLRLRIQQTRALLDQVESTGAFPI